MAITETLGENPIAEPDENETPVTVTVITEDCSYDLKATSWRTDETNQLHLYDGEQLVATFATTKWICIWKATTGAAA